MKTEHTLNIDGFRFTITGKTEKGYDLEIERRDGMETIIAYSTLESIAGIWILMGMTFEDAHPFAFLKSFLNALWSIQKEALPEVVKYYEANRKPDIFEAIDKLEASFKKIGCLEIPLKKSN